MEFIYRCINFGVYTLEVSNLFFCAGALLFFALLGLSGCFITCYDRRVRNDLAQPCRELCLCCCQPGYIISSSICNLLYHRWQYLSVSHFLIIYDLFLVFFLLLIFRSVQVFLNSQICHWDQLISYFLFVNSRTLCQIQNFLIIVSGCVPIAICPVLFACGQIVPRASRVVPVRLGSVVAWEPVKPVCLYYSWWP